MKDTWCVIHIKNTVKGLHYVGTAKSDKKAIEDIIPSNIFTSFCPQMTLDHMKNPRYFTSEIVQKDLPRSYAKQIALDCQNAYMQKGESYMDGHGGHRTKSSEDLDRFELACTAEHKKWLIWYAREIEHMSASRVLDKWIGEKMKEFKG
jgi:hypothetical protein